MVAFCTPPVGDLAKNPGMCPDQELNWPHFGLQAHAQPTEPHQLSQGSAFNKSPCGSLSVFGVGDGDEGSMRYAMPGSIRSPETDESLQQPSYFTEQGQQ